MVRAVIDGGADCLQLRAKDVSGEEFYTLACRLAELCRAAGVVSIINDRPDIAVASGADRPSLSLNRKTQSAQSPQMAENRC